MALYLFNTYLSLRIWDKIGIGLGLALHLRVGSGPGRGPGQGQGQDQGQGQGQALVWASRDRANSSECTEFMTRIKRSHTPGVRGHGGSLRFVHCSSLRVIEGEGTMVFRGQSHCGSTDSTTCNEPQ